MKGFWPTAQEIHAQRLVTQFVYFTGPTCWTWTQTWSPSWSTVLRPFFTYLHWLINYINVVTNERIKCPTSNSIENKLENWIYLPFHDDFSPAKHKYLQTGMVPLRGFLTYFWDWHHDSWGWDSLISMCSHFCGHFQANCHIFRHESDLIRNKTIFPLWVMHVSC